jgi:hypothetical protein
MSRLSARQILNLILAVLVTAGLSLSVVWADGSPAKARTAMGMEMGVAAFGYCHKCPSGGGDAAKAVVCDGAMCSSPILAAAPQIAVTPHVQVRALFGLLQPPLHGRTPPPEPYPPKPSRIA